MVKTTGCKKVASGWMTQMHSFSGESFANFEALNQCYSDVYLRLVFYQEAIYIYMYIYMLAIIIPIVLIIRTIIVVRVTIIRRNTSI